MNKSYLFWILCTRVCPSRGEVRKLLKGSGRVDAKFNVLSKDLLVSMTFSIFKRYRQCIEIKV